MQRRASRDFRGRANARSGMTLTVSLFFPDRRGCFFGRGRRQRRSTGLLGVGAGLRRLGWDFRRPGPRCLGLRGRGRLGFRAGRGVQRRCGLRQMQIRLGQPRERKPRHGETASNHDGGEQQIGAQGTFPDRFHGYTADCSARQRSPGGIVPRPAGCLKWAAKVPASPPRRPRRQMRAWPPWRSTPGP